MPNSCANTSPADDHPHPLLQSPLPSSLPSPPLLLPSSPLPPPLTHLPPSLPSSSRPPHLPPSPLQLSINDSCMIHGAAAWERFHFVTRHELPPFIMIHPLKEIHRWLKEVLARDPKFWKKVGRTRMQYSLAREARVTDVS